MSAGAPDCARILVADDEPTMLNAYQRVFLCDSPPGSEDMRFSGDFEGRLFGDNQQLVKRPSFHLECYGRASEAVEAIRRAAQEGSPFAVAVFDVRMPLGPGGIWAVEQARAIDPDLEIVIVTAHSDIDPQEIARRVPPADQLLYVQKPVQPEAMRYLAGTSVAKWSAHKRARQAQADLEAANEDLRREVRAREQAEQGLRQSEAVLRSVFRALPSGVGVVRNRTIEWANERLEEITGYTMTDLVAHNARLLYENDQEFDRVRTAYAQLEAGQTASIETQWRRKDGSLIDVMLGASYLGPTGPSASVAFTATDITERKRAEEALRESERLYREAIEAARGVPYLHRFGSESYDFVGPGVEALLGVSANELDPEALGRMAREVVITEPHAPASLQEYDRLYRLGEVQRYRVDMRVVTPSGEEKWVSDCATQVRDAKTGEITGSLGILQDITQRKYAERALHESEERFRALIENASDVVITVDEDGTITFSSPSAARVLGYDPKDVVGRSAFDFVHPGDQAVAREAFQRVLEDGDTRQITEFRVSTKDGSWRHMQAVAGVPDEGAPIHGIIINCRDVTEWRQLEENLQQASKLQSIGTLAGGVAHDFNNVLTGIIGYTDMLKTEEAVVDEHMRDVDKIRHLADRAAGLTRQLLLFSRQQLIEPVVLDPNDLVENLSKMLRRIIGEDIELELVLAPDLGNVRADPGQIEQVLMNLAVNARDAMPEGGCLTIETANLSLDERYADDHVGLEPGSYATISVSDTGCGMDADTRQRAFDPFFTTKEIGKGTGLGLATVYGITQQHDGGVWVYSEPGQGSTFKVYLPRVDERAQDAQTREEESPPKGSETILLVEDEEMVRDVARQALQKRGYRVLDASNPDEAKGIFEQHQSEIALLLTDVVMPGKTGPGLYEWLTPKRPPLKVLFMSGYTEHAAVSRDLLGGELPFLQKPFTPAALAQKVREVLDS